MPKHFWKWTITFAMVAVAIGCHRDPFAYEQVAGTIHDADGRPIACARLVVILISQEVPLDDRTHPRNGMVDVRADGTFDVVTTNDYGDGAIRGRHKVTVVALDENESPIEAVPSEYTQAETTPLEFDTSESPWEIIIAAADR